MNRDTIGTAMQALLNTAFTTYCYATIDYFQLLSGKSCSSSHIQKSLFTVALPDDFETAISDTEVEKQLISTAQAQLLQAQVTLNTTMLEAQYTAQTTIVTILLMRMFF